MKYKEATTEELRAVQEKMLNCLNGLLMDEACTVALNTFCFVMMENDVELEDVLNGVREYYSLNRDKEWRCGSH